MSRRAQRARSEQFTRQSGAVSLWTPLRLPLEPHDCHVGKTAVGGVTGRSFRLPAPCALAPQLRRRPARLSHRTSAPPGFGEMSETESGGVAVHPETSNPSTVTGRDRTSIVVAHALDCAPRGMRCEFGGASGRSSGRCRSPEWALTQWCAARCCASTSRPKSASGSRQTECAWLAPRWVLSHSMSSRGPWSR